MGVVERLSFEAVSSHELIASEHVHRYELAAALCAGMSVVDLACGVGYGSEILLGEAKSVLGIDNDAATVDTVGAAYRDRDGLSFSAMDADEFLRSPEAGAAQAIVCFEGLEHFADPDETLALLADLGRAGARIVLSVPNSRAFEEDNRYHLTDYGYETAMEAFESLGTSHVLFQFLAEGSMIRTREASGVDGRFVLSEHGEPEYANHFIGLVTSATPTSRLNSTGVCSWRWRLCIIGLFAHCTGPTASSGRPTPGSPGRRREFSIRPQRPCSTGSALPTSASALATSASTAPSTAPTSASEAPRRSATSGMRKPIAYRPCGQTSRLGTPRSSSASSSSRRCAVVRWCGSHSHSPACDPVGGRPPSELS